MDLDTDALLAAAEADLATAGDPGAVDALSARLLGKKSELAAAKKALGELDPDARREAGQRLNDTRARLQALLDARREALAAEARRTQLEAERLDLTEVRARVARGHYHLVTQARDRLEDVFVGMGYQVAEGPEVETAWYNFEALNIPEWHPARGSFDTIFVDLGEPESVMLRSHTSPVQIRTMENQEPPIYIVAPGRTFRTDAADATHLPAFNQIEGLVVDEG
ncbi:MAG: phenylalanine--tRNA ligase subunit alpha, partial [Acidimicrobiia bacterium]|nr:phenylalanine--tRNA ligase subunit alpha [Acidimicrobiia bacterium]